MMRLELYINQNKAKCCKKILQLIEAELDYNSIRHTETYSICKKNN